MGSLSHNYNNITDMTLKHDNTDTTDDPDVSTSTSGASSESPKTPPLPEEASAAPAPSSSSMSSNETVYETAARLLFMSVRWTKNLASFSALPGNDQALLLEESWSELFLVCSIQWSLPLHQPAASIFSSSQFPDLQHPLLTALNQLEALMDTFKELDIDPAEFACLKAIILFKPEVVGLKDRKEVENLQDQSLSMLQHQVTNMPQMNMMSSNRMTTRYARLILAISTLKNTSSEVIEKIYFEKTIGATPMKKLLCDMFKS